MPTRRWHALARAIAGSVFTAGWMVGVPGISLADPLKSNLDLCIGLTADIRVKIIGTDRDDTLWGTPFGDCIYGLGGNDTIFGLGGNDMIVGGAGADTIDGGDGNDKLYGGTGNDKIDGGPGNDTGYGQPGDDIECEECLREAKAKQGTGAAPRSSAAPDVARAELGLGRPRLRSGNCPW